MSHGLLSSTQFSFWLGSFQETHSCGLFIPWVALGWFLRSIIILPPIVKIPTSGFTSMPCWISFSMRCCSFDGWKIRTYQFFPSRKAKKRSCTPDTLLGSCGSSPCLLSSLEFTGLFISIVTIPFDCIFICFYRDNCSSSPLGPHWIIAFPGGSLPESDGLSCSSATYEMPTLFLLQGKRQV